MVVWLTHAEPGGTGFWPLCGRYIFLVHTYAVTQTVQIRGIIMTTTAAAYRPTAVVAYDQIAPHKKRTEKLRKKKYVNVVNM